MAVLSEGNPLQEILERTITDSRRVRVPDMIEAPVEERHEIRDSEWPAQVLVTARRKGA